MRPSADINVDCVEPASGDVDLEAGLVRPADRDIEHSDRSPGQDLAGVFEQIVVSLDQVVPRHGVDLIRPDAEIFDRLPGRRPDPERATQRDAQLCALGQRLERPVRPVLEQPGMVEHVGPAGTGVRVDAEDRADVVIGEAGREHVAGRVAQCVGDQHHRAVIELADRVDDLGR